MPPQIVDRYGQTFAFQSKTWRILRERANPELFKGCCKRSLQFLKGIQNILLLSGEGIMTSVLSAKSHTTVKRLFTFHFQKLR
jgi:hypothetical protein